MATLANAISNGSVEIVGDLLARGARSQILNQIIDKTALKELLTYLEKSKMGEGGGAWHKNERDGMNGDDVAVAHPVEVGEAKAVAMYTACKEYIIAYIRENASNKKILLDTFPTLCEIGFWTQRIYMEPWGNRDSFVYALRQVADRYHDVEPKFEQYMHAENLIVPYQKM